jgi:uncharacterized protein
MRQWTTKDYRTMPWKNGGGSTTELAIFPEGASIDHFVWRLSTATVAQSGPFSHFSQIDRTLAILSGDGLLLKTDSGMVSEKSYRLTQESAPHRFSGEDNIAAELLGSTVVDINLMTRRDVCQHFMQKLFAGEHVVRAEDAQQILIFCEKGNATINKKTHIEAGDLLLIEEEQEDAGITLHMQADEASLLYVMRISFLNHHTPHGGHHVLG